MNKRILPLLLVVLLLVGSGVANAAPVSAPAPLVRYHILFDETINEGRFKTLQLEHKPLLEMLKRLDFTFSANQECTLTDSIELPLTQVGTTTTRAGGTGNMTITGRADLIEGRSYTYAFEGTLTYSSEMEWVDDRPDIPPAQGTGGTIKYQSTGPFRIALTNEETPGKSMVDYGGSSGTDRAAKSARYAKTNIKNGTVSESVRDPDTIFTSLAFYVYTSRHVDALPTEEKKDDSFTFTGTIVDYADRPMKHMEVWITAEGGTYKGTTDAGGNYSIKAEGLEELPSTYTITTVLRYKKDEKEYFVLILPAGADNYYFNVKKEVIVNGESDLHCEYVLSKNHPAQGFSPLIRKILLDNITTVYHYMSQVVEFYDSLNLYKDFNIPAVSVRCYDSSEGGTLYYPGRGIYIAQPDMENSSPEAPHNREWHEYNHHVMYSIYGKWPEGVADGYRVNHAGFVNASTADSYMEGFAEFMALVTSDHYDLGNGSIYAPIADMDLYYKPWDWRGQAEELSVAGILWKLYDGVYAKEVGSTLEKLWSVMKTYSKDFGEVYEKLIAAFTDKAGTIDALFISHGFFQSAQTGNGEYDLLEPFIDQNSSRRHDTGEVFIDLPINDKGKVEVRCEADAKAGYAADAGRPDRRSPLSPVGHFIKTDNAVPYYTVDYEFIGQPELNYSVKTSNREGLIAVVVPPSEYMSTVTVKPWGVTYDNSLSFSSEEFYASYDQNVAQGSFVEHDFKVSGEVHPLEPVGASVLSESLPYPLETIEGQTITAPVSTTPSAPEPESKDAKPVIADNAPAKSGGNTLLFIIPILIVMTIGVVVVFLKSRR